MNCHEFQLVEDEPKKGFSRTTKSILFRIASAQAIRKFFLSNLAKALYDSLPLPTR